MRNVILGYAPFRVRAAIAGLIMFAAPATSIASPNYGFPEFPSALPTIPTGISLPSSGGQGGTRESGETPLDQSPEVKRATLQRQQQQNSEGGGEAVESEDGTRSQTVGSGGGKKVVIPYLDPVEGSSGTMNNQDALRFVSNTSSSKVGLYNIVTNLTEPGVAQGINNALSQSQGMWGNRLLSEAHFSNTASGEPEGRQILAARENCISTEMGGGKDPSQAVARCSGGSRVVTALETTGNTTATAVGAAPTMREIDPNHAKYRDPRIPPGQQTVGDITDSPCQADDEVCGTDYIFNQEIRYLATLVEPPFLNRRSAATEAAIADLNQARKDFLDFVGDIRFKAQMEKGTLQSISSNLVPPRSEGSVDLIIARQQRGRYEDFNALMKLYCQWSNQICTGTICSGGLSRDELIKAQYPTERGDNNPQNVSAAIRDFWRDARDAKPIRARLSTSTFLMHSKIVEDLYNLYKRDSAFSSKTGDGPTGACGGFYTGNGEPANFDALYGPTPLAGRDLVNPNSAWHKPIYQISRMIGEASYLDFLGRMGSKISNKLITSTGLTSRVRLEVLGLLNRAAIKRSKTGSLTIEEEMFSQSKRIHEAAAKMILEPAKESTAQSTEMQQQSLTGAASQASGSKMMAQGTN